MAEKGEILMEVKELYKNFGVTIAVDHVDLCIRRGEILGLIGENGSGKSTITSIIAGIHQATSGQMFYMGEKWKPGTSLEASKRGVGIIVQEVGTIASISVAENIFIGEYKHFKKGPFIQKKKMNREAGEVLKNIGVEGIDPSKPTFTYNIEQRKLIEIAKIMAAAPELILVDETSTALSESGRKIMYEMIHNATQSNKAVVFISHDLEELMEHCDRLTILRDGKVIDNIERNNFDPDDIKRKMIGREMATEYYRSDYDGYSEEVVLEADCITTMENLLCFNLELHKGEILGIGGLSECGMHTLGRALYGLEDVVDGEVRITSSNTVVDRPDTAFKNGMGYVSKNRDRESLELDASIRANIQSTGYKINRILGPFISSKKERDYAGRQVDALEIKSNSINQPVRTLSGGNKQKVVFGKWIAEDADILILDCPTRGVDIGVKAAMYNLIYSMKKAGKSIIIISEELPELCGMSDRLLILREGKISGSFLRSDGYDNEKLIEAMI